MRRSNTRTHFLSIAMIVTLGALSFSCSDGSVIAQVDGGADMKILPDTTPVDGAPLPDKRKKKKDTGVTDGAVKQDITDETDVATKKDGLTQTDINTKPDIATKQDKGAPVLDGGGIPAKYCTMPGALTTTFTKQVGSLKKLSLIAAQGKTVIIGEKGRTNIQVQVSSGTITKSVSGTTFNVQYKNNGVVRVPANFEIYVNATTGDSCIEGVTGKIQSGAVTGTPRVYADLSKGGDVLVTCSQSNLYFSMPKTQGATLLASGKKVDLTGITFTGMGGNGQAIASGTLGSGTVTAKVTLGSTTGTATIRGH